MPDMGLCMLHVLERQLPPPPLAPCTVFYSAFTYICKAALVLKLEGALLSAKSSGIGLISPDFKGQPRGRVYLSGSFWSPCIDNGNGTFRIQFL